VSGVPAGAGSLIGKRLGKYEVLALLALGGTAEIYLARIGGAAGFEKYVVVKCLHDHLADDTEFVKMFLDEARLAAHLDHSNIVQTFELGEHDNRYYMVMEFLAGLSLAMIVRRAGERLPSGRIPVNLVLNIVAQACAGLHYAHDKTSNGKVLNIVHRDISPQNLVVSFEGVVKVVDFGIAKAELRETRTRSGTIKGKFAYMSPEQCVANNVDRRTDVFALGVIAHELLTGKRLFKRPSPYETYQAVLDCNVLPPSRENVELDPSLDALVMKAVEKDKEKRYPTAEAFGDALQSYLHHRGKGSGPGDVGRFLDESFAQEIEEHSGRMRELIAGRAMDTGGWDEEEEEQKRNETVDLRGRAKLGPEELGESSGVSELSDLGDAGANGESDDELQADRTRIEANPLEMERVSTTDMSQPAPLPPTPSAPVQMSAKRFGPDAANLPTMIAEPDPEPELAPTEMGAPLAVRQTAARRAPTPPPLPSNLAPTAALRPHNGPSASQPNMQAQSGPQGSMPPPMMEPAVLLGSGSHPAQSAPFQQVDPMSVMSPVGESYPVVDWAEAAAVPIRVVPPWMLALLFVAALGVALGVTLIIAMIIR
jgi:eukaryotic-like serine/threonine-protein kinase